AGARANREQVATGGDERHAVCTVDDDAVNPRVTRKPDRAEGSSGYAHARAEPRMRTCVHCANDAGLRGDGDVAAGVADDRAGERAGKSAGWENGGSRNYHREEKLLHWASPFVELVTPYRDPSYPDSCEICLMRGRARSPARSSAGQTGPPAPA